MLEEYRSITRTCRLLFERRFKATADSQFQYIIYGGVQWAYHRSWCINRPIGLISRYHG